MRLSVSDQRVSLERPVLASQRWTRIAHALLIALAFVFVAAITLGLMG